VISEVEKGSSFSFIIEDKEIIDNIDKEDCDIISSNY
jgi:hypothetical protein